MSRRPLGASLSPAERLAAYEKQIRELQAAIGEVEYAMAVVDEYGFRAYPALRRAIVGLQEVKERPIGLRPGPKPRV
jgi:hypothetical protein